MSTINITDADLNVLVHQSHTCIITKLGLGYIKPRTFGVRVSLVSRAVPFINMFHITTCQAGLFSTSYHELSCEQNTISNLLVNLFFIQISFYLFEKVQLELIGYSGLWWLWGCCVVQLISGGYTATEVLLLFTAGTDCGWTYTGLGQLSVATFSTLDLTYQCR